MSDLTSELNLSLAVDDDDTRDYLAQSLRDSLTIIDGLFNQATGHAHNGSHQGGQLQFLDLSVGGNLTVTGASDLHGSVHCYANLTVNGIATPNSLDVTTTSHLRGAVTMDAGLTITGAINSTGTVTIGTDLQVNRDLAVARNASITGTLTVGAITTGGGGLNVGGNLIASGVVIAARYCTTGYDTGQVMSINGSGVASGYWYQRGSTSYRCYDNADFAYGVGIAASTLVQRDGSGQVQAQGVYMPSGAQGGRPTYVVGQTGDGWMRWWPANAIGPPAVTRFMQGSIGVPGLGPGGGNTDAYISAWSNSLGAGGLPGSTFSVPYAGYYSIAGGCQGSNLTGNSETLRIRLISRDHGELDNADTPIKISSYWGAYFSWSGFLNAGETLRINFQTSFDAINGQGELLVAFIPVSDYPN